MGVGIFLTMDTVRCKYHAGKIACRRGWKDGAHQLVCAFGPGPQRKCALMALRSSAFCNLYSKEMQGYRLQASKVWIVRCLEVSGIPKRGRNKRGG